MPSSFVNTCMKHEFKFTNCTHNYGDGAHVDLGLEFRDRLHRTWSNDDLATFHLFTFDAAEEGTHIVASLALIYIKHKLKGKLDIHLLGPVPCGTSLIMVS
jgi:hypothetical protein